MKRIKRLSAQIKKALYIFNQFLCRIYSSTKKDHDLPADIITTGLASTLFFIVHGYMPHFRKPRSFSEKLFNRMLYSRDRKWPLVSDKLLVRDFVKEIVGGEVLIPLLWYGTIEENIPFDELPQRCVIKMNHGCGFIIFYQKNKNKEVEDVLEKIKEWGRINYCLDKFMGLEWAYKNIVPKILIEPFIEEEGKPPKDYKFFCFMGRVEYILITYDRFGDHWEKHFTRDFKALNLWNGADQFPGPFIMPQKLDEMIQIAEKLSAEFDFMRVDLYNIHGKIYFGELTCYPAGGLAPFIPREWDFIFGSKWFIN